MSKSPSVGGQNLPVFKDCSIDSDHPNEIQCKAKIEGKKAHKKRIEGESVDRYQ
jgi:hypothetical protein